MDFSLDLDEAEKVSKFVKLRDGESITGIFRGNTHGFYLRWDANVPVISHASDPEAKFRFRVNFITQDYRPMIFDQPRTVYKQLAQLQVDYDLGKTWVKITRRGEGRETKYSILPLRNGDVTPEQSVALSDVKLWELSHHKEEG